MMATPPPPPPPSWPSGTPPTRKQPRALRLIWQAAVSGATLVLVAGFVVTFSLAHGAHQTAKTSTTLGIGTQTTTGTITGTVTGPGAGPAPTATATANPNATATPTPGATATPLPQENLVSVTQNQDMRPTCLDTPQTPYTIQMANSGNVAVHWQVVIPMQPGVGAAHHGPLSASPYWAWASPTNGTIAAGQTASFVMNPDTAIPCGGKSYTASIKVSFAGGWQPDIPLTYAGTGPAPYSQVVLVSGTLNMTQPCPTGGATPASFTFTIQNNGNAEAYPYWDTKDTVGRNDWVNQTAFTTNPPNPPDIHGLYPGESWTFTMTPRADVQCNGTVYHLDVYSNNAQGTTTTFTFTDTFQ